MKCFNTKIFFTKILFWAAAAGGTGIMMTGCAKPDDLYSPEEGTIYMPQAYQDRSVMTLYKMDSIQQVTFGAYYSGFNGPGSDVTVQFEVDPALVTQYNINYGYLGYTYYPLPDSVYTLSSNTGTIKAGKKSSEPLFVLVNGQKISFGYHYLLPVKIKSVSAGNKDSALSVTYFKLDSLQTRVKDITPLGTLTVSDENRDGANAKEGSVKLVDNDYSTKFLSFNYNPNFWMQLKLNTPQRLDAYEITSGNDAPDRDPKNWLFQGSNNGTDWTTLDNRKDEIFLGRQLTRRFNVNFPNAYTYYRMLVTVNGGSSLIQITEWKIIQFY
ncbi:BT_3987 domain-containing protein [Niabella hirudinis]|uniref:BT_3987 domain-containing protein n=1 Tax=Niabella hirudinis TaxID=1285929 RepID=UPI003EB8CFDB